MYNGLNIWEFYIKRLKSNGLRIIYYKLEIDTNSTDKNSNYTLGNMGTGNHILKYYFLCFILFLYKLHSEIYIIYSL